ncbi:MAG: MBL fold metallo-hydrolase [Anaerolineales bacterium]|nr:MBL fold metallo-hydrolase [Anaerolineales bacterium]
MVLGPVGTNAYLAADTQTLEAVVIDPAWDGHLITAQAKRRGWQIGQVWVTHAHFDHFGGVGAVVKGIQPAPQVALHPQDLWLWRNRGGAALFGMHMEAVEEPDLLLEQGDRLQVGGYSFEVRHTPGHSAGHVIFYCAAEKVLFCGDVVFEGSIGRTDLPGGDYDTLIRSIHEQVLSLPDETRLLSGHGEMTTVGRERKGNPFLS